MAFGFPFLMAFALLDEEFFVVLWIWTGEKKILHVSDQSTATKSENNSVYTSESMTKSLWKKPENSISMQ